MKHRHGKKRRETDVHASLTRLLNTRTRLGRRLQAAERRKSLESGVVSILGCLGGNTSKEGCNRKTPSFTPLLSRKESLNKTPSAFVSWTNCLQPLIAKQSTRRSSLCWKCTVTTQRKWWLTSFSTNSPSCPVSIRPSRRHHNLSRQIHCGSGGNFEDLLTLGIHWMPNEPGGL